MITKNRLIMIKEILIKRAKEEFTISKAEEKRFRNKELDFKSIESICLFSLLPITTLLIIIVEKIYNIDISLNQPVLIILYAIIISAFILNAFWYKINIPQLANNLKINKSKPLNFYNTKFQNKILLLVLYTFTARTITQLSDFSDYMIFYLPIWIYIVLKAFQLTFKITAHFGLENNQELSKNSLN